MPSTRHSLFKYLCISVCICDLGSWSGHQSSHAKFEWSHWNSVWDTPNLMFLKPGNESMVSLEYISPPFKLKVFASWQTCQLSSINTQHSHGILFVHITILSSFKKRKKKKSTELIIRPSVKDHARIVTDKPIIGHCPNYAHYFPWIHASVTNSMMYLITARIVGTFWESCGMTWQCNLFGKMGKASLPKCAH